MGTEVWSDRVDGFGKAGGVPIAKRLAVAYAAVYASDSGPLFTALAEVRSDPDNSN